MKKWIKKISVLGFSMGSIIGIAGIGLVNNASNLSQKISNLNVWNGNVVKNFSNYPYMASVNINNNQNLYDSHYGGATFITQNLLLTAGHIVSNRDGSLISPQSIKIAYGGINLKNEQNFTVFNVKAVYRIDNYTDVKLGPGVSIGLNDVAIIQIENHPQRIVKTVTLVNKDDGEKLSSAGVKDRIIGWGFSQAFVAVSAKLRYSDHIIQSDKQANEYLHKLPKVYWKAYYSKETIANLSIGMHESTQGDSGGPALVYDKTVNENIEIGICSWGPGTKNNSLDFYTRLDNPLYLEWIQYIIKLHKTIS